MVLRSSESHSDKFFVFHGDVAVVNVHTARFSDHHQERYYTPDWRVVEIRHPDCLIAPVATAPPSLDRMLTIASRIGAEFDFIRVDLYDIDVELWFRELTPYHGSGLDPFQPVEWDPGTGSSVAHGYLDLVATPFCGGVVQPVRSL